MNNKKRGFQPQKTLAALAVSTALMLSMPAAMAVDKTSGALIGHVVVSAGATLSNVQVTIKHQSKGLKRTTTTNEKGDFNLKALPIGKYTVTFRKNGYETVEEQEVVVKAGSSAKYNISMYETGVERISVTGSNVQMVDFESSTTQLVLTADDIARLPIGQDLTSVALLAPGSSLAADPDADYGRGASFNGSSVAENGFFLNGLNITDIRKGLGSIDLPWEAIAQTNIVTGGVSAEYGQFIGGVTDLVSKSGDNEFKFGVTVDYIPSSMASQSPDTWGYSLQSDDDGNYPFDPVMINNNGDSNYEETRYNIYASGAIVEDTLFFYGIFNPQDIKDEYANANEIDSRQYTKKDKQADYWLAKVDWFINDEHNIGFTALNNEWEQSRSTRTTGDAEFSAPNKSTWGGSMWSANYSGIITDEITINAIYGVTEQTSDSINPTAEHSPVWDRRDNWGWEKIGKWVGDYKQELRDDQRTQFRLDLDWEFGDHTLRFGYSQEVVETSDNIAYAGDGKTYEYRIMSQGTLDWLNGKRADIGQGEITGISAGDDYYRAREYDRVGTAESTNSAIYIQDTWNVTDDVTLNIGIRNSAFESKTGEGDVYADMDNQWAPRLGAIWDVNGDGTTKVSVNYGRYFMPISPNTSVRMTLGETNQYDYAKFDEIGADGLPTNPESMYLLNYGDGTFTQPYETLVDADLDPMYSDEFSVAITHELNENWIVGARYVYQDLKSSIEDTNMKFVLSKWMEENPEEAAKLDPNWDISGSWVGFVINPGSSAHLSYDQDGDGTISSGEGVTWSADYIGLPQAERTYQALEFTLEGRPTENSTLQASYTYSRSEGNTEGLVSGTHSQADPGWSGSFDSPEFTDHSYGRTSNDIPHKFKVFGTYDITENLNIGLVFLAQEGRARNILGYHPQDVDSCADDKNITWCDDWDRNNFYADGQPSARGAGGHGKWITSLDMSVNYNIDLGDAGQVRLSAKAFNVLDSDTAASYNDMTEFDKNIGSTNPNYGNATSYQSPRSFLLTASYDF
ncbi:MAG: TonB-dependent receptor [Colwellia sp.]|nr:TonB-dependent receptor [Colwellia sp.]